MMRVFVIYDRQTGRIFSVLLFPSVLFILLQQERMAFSSSWGPPADRAHIGLPICICAVYLYELLLLLLGRKKTL